MWKKLISISLIIAFISLFTLASAEAGSKQRYMWYGAGIGLGAAALGLMAHRLYTQPPPGSLLSTVRTSLLSSPSTT